jgi:sugar lactone lactonase YvrE
VILAVDTMGDRHKVFVKPVQAEGGELLNMKPRVLYFERDPDNSEAVDRSEEQPGWQMDRIRRTTLSTCAKQMKAQEKNGAMHPITGILRMQTRSYYRRLTIVCCLVVCSLVSAGAADDDPKAAVRASLERVQALRKERPGDGVLIFYQALLQVELGERESAFELLRSLQGRKLGLIPYRDGGFDSVWGDPKFQEIRRTLMNEEPQTAVSPVAFRLKDPKLIPEGIAFDPGGDRFFVGSIAQRKIIVSDGQGETHDFSSPADKLDQVLGIRIDPARGQLYAVSTNASEENAKKERRNAVLRYNLKTGKLIDRFSAPEAMQLNDLVVRSDGTIYVTDSAGGSLFRRQADETTLTRFGAAGALRGANGIALSKDGTLYVAISTGIARVDLSTGEPTRLSQSDTVVTGGIDGLYWDEGDLLGVQNGTNPGRVIRITLTDKGDRISGITVLQSSQHPDFDEPTTGAIARGALYVIGNSYVGRYQPDETIKDAGELKGTAVIAVPLRR